MMLRTHLAINALAMLFFLSVVSQKFVFIFTVLIATILPDIDTGFSTIGKLKTARIVQFLTKHRGFFHSLTFCCIVSVILAFFIPVLAFGFFLGYSLHLLADSFTIEGIKPFWPLKKTSSWKIRTGSYTETSLFILFLFFDIFLFVLIIANMA